MSKTKTFDCHWKMWIMGQRRHIYFISFTVNKNNYICMCVFEICNPFIISGAFEKSRSPR